MILLLAGIPFATVEASFPEAGEEAVSLYNQGEFSKATEKFLEALALDPDNPELAYNLGNSQYKQGRYEEALDSYAKTLKTAQDPNLKQKAYYNQGNAYYRLGYLDKAIDAYKAALKLDPSDVDSKFNLELSRKQWEQALKSGQIAPRDKSTPANPRDGGNNPSSPKSETGSGPPDGEPSDTEQAPLPDHPIPPNKQARENPQPPSETSTPSADAQDGAEHRMAQQALREITAMTPEEAERWLNSLNEDFKKIYKRQMQGEMKDLFIENRKDW